MRNEPKRYVIIVLLILLISSLGAKPSVFAEKEHKPITIDLDTPRSKEPEQEDDALEEKYREILAEVTISEEAELVAENIKDTITTLRDLTFNATIVQIKGGRSDSLSLAGKFGIEQGLARVEFLQPSALRGQIAVIDQEKMEAKIFQPVTNQIAVRGLEDMSKEALSALNVAQDITSYFDFTQYEIVVLETTEYNGINEYFLQVDSGDEDILQIRVREDTWFPSEIVVFEDGVRTGSITFQDVVFNPGLDREDLQNLPKVKEVRL